MSHRLLRATLDLLPPPSPGVELEHGLRRRWLHLVEVTLDVLYPADGQAPADEDLELTDDTLVELVDQAIAVALDDAADEPVPAEQAPTFGPYICHDCGRQFPRQQGLGGHRARCPDRRAKARAAELEVEARKAGASKPQAPSASSLALFAGERSDLEPAPTVARRPVIVPSTAELAARDEEERLRARIAATKADSLGSRRTITSPDPNAYPKD